jgi:hypothetical protein
MLPSYLLPKTDRLPDEKPLGSKLAESAWPMPAFSVAVAKLLSTVAMHARSATGQIISCITDKHSFISSLHLCQIGKFYPETSQSASLEGLVKSNTGR